MLRGSIMNWPWKRKTPEEKEAERVDKVRAIDKKLGVLRLQLSEQEGIVVGQRGKGTKLVDGSRYSQTRADANARIKDIKAKIEKLDEARDELDSPRKAPRGATLRRA